MNAKRIVIFSCFYDPYFSGAERMVKEVVERLSGRFDFYIVTARLSRALPRMERRTTPWGEYTILRIGFGVKIDKFLYSLFAPLSVFRLKPEVVHAVMESYAGLALWLYKIFGGRRKTILTLQSGDLDMPEKVKTIPPFVWRGIHSSPDLVVGISAALANRAKRLGARETMVVPNGVDLKHLADLKIDERISHRVVTVARLSPEKGLTYLIAGLPFVVEKFPDAHLVIVGGGILKDALAEQARALNISNHITFTGALSNQEAMQEVAKSAVFVLASLGEGLGIVLLEAQALGVPVIGTNVGGIPDVIENDVTGFLAPVQNGQAIAEAVIKIFEDQDFANKLIRNAEARLARFDWQTIAEQYAEIYHRFL